MLASIIAAALSFSGLTAADSQDGSVFADGHSLPDNVGQDGTSRNYGFAQPVNLRMPTEVVGGLLHYHEPQI